jgi:hypothetical protein
MSRIRWLACALLLGTSSLSAQERQLQSATPPLPSSFSLAGNLVHGGRWYALSSDENACVNKLLAGKEWFTPEGIAHVSLPPQAIRLDPCEFGKTPYIGHERQNTVKTSQTALGVFWFALIQSSLRLLSGDEPPPRERITATLGVIREVSLVANNIVCEWASTRLTFMAVNPQAARSVAKERIESQFGSSPVSVYDVNGKKLPATVAAKRMKPGDVVLVSEDEQLPDLRYLRVLKDDVLVLVRAPFEANLIPVPNTNLPQPVSRQQKGSGAAGKQSPSADAR